MFAGAQKPATLLLTGGVDNASLMGWLPIDLAIFFYDLRGQILFSSRVQFASCVVVVSVKFPRMVYLPIMDLE